MNKIKDAYICQDDYVCHLVGRFDDEKNQVRLIYTYFKDSMVVDHKEFIGLTYEQALNLCQEKEMENNTVLLA